MTPHWLIYDTIRFPSWSLAYMFASSIRSYQYETDSQVGKAEAAGRPPFGDQQPKITLVAVI